MPVLTEKTKGTCKFCGKSFSRQGMGRHLKACKARQQQMDEPLVSSPQGRRAKVRTENIYHLFVEATYIPLYWLHLEVPGNESLRVLDRFLRDIWLECCGHLSMFKIGNVHYDVMGGDDRFSIFPPIEGLSLPETRDMNVRLDKVLVPGLEFEHEYDFGSTTYLKLRVMDVRTGPVRGKGIVDIMSRNDPLEITCDTCDKAATEVCTQCMWDEDSAMWVCEDCAPQHQCGEEMLLPVVNSPRMGECGYTGPLEDYD